MSEYEDLGESFVDLIAAIYEATCADCFEAHPGHLCCDSFLCSAHYLAHERLYHPERAAA